MRKLELDEIEKLASRCGVKRIAVENFLISITANPDRNCATQNAYFDQILYGWNGVTLKAILDGIDLAYETDLEEWHQ